MASGDALRPSTTPPEGSASASGSSEQIGLALLPLSSSREKRDTDAHQHHSHSNQEDEISVHSTEDARSLAAISLPPSEGERDDGAAKKIYGPFSLEVIALLMSASVFGTLARLEINALASYDGAGIFALAWVQAVGCVIMGFGLAMKGYLGDLWVFYLGCEKRCKM